MAEVVFVIAIILFFGVVWSLAVVEPGTGLRAHSKEIAVNALRIIGGLIAMGLLIYLVATLLKPNLVVDNLSGQHSSASPTPTTAATSTAT